MSAWHNDRDGLGSGSHRVGLLIVGGGPTGLACARGYRDAGGSASVLMISADQYPPYNRPPLTKDYLRGESAADALPLVDADWYAEHDVGLVLETRVTRIDRDAREVITGAGDAVGYETLVLATGSSPTPLPIEGADLPEVIYVRDRASGERLRELRGADVTAVVIGSGFIGCEAAASLARTGTSVTMLTGETVPHERRLGPDAGHRIADWLRSDGVDLQTDAEVSRIERRDDGRWRVTLADGRSLGCDAVVSASGATPDPSLAREAGLSVRDDAIAVDASMRSSDPTVWAAGDVASAINRAAGRPLRVEHWGEAETMGEIAGRAIAGQDDALWDQPPGFWSEIGDHTIKYSAWGDGFDHAELLDTETGWAVLYAADGLIVGVLCHEWDDAYEHAQQMIADHTPFAEAKVALTHRRADQERTK